MSHLNTLDNRLYVERRAERYDDAQARVEAAAAQAARRHVAISKAVMRLRAVASLTADRVFDRAAVNELLAEIALDLETANRVRSTDREAVSE